MKRTLKQQTISNRRQNTVPIISLANRRKRLLWAEEHENWTLGDWKNVAWSGETRFQLRNNSSVRICTVHHDDEFCKSCHTALSPLCSEREMQRSDGSMIVWGIYSWHTLGPVVPVDLTLNAATYLNIVANQVHPFMATVYPEGNGILQHDNAAHHKAKLVTKWFGEHSTDLTVMEWPPQSFDLNPIKELWNAIDCEIRSLPDTPRDLIQLRTAILQVWVNFAPHKYQKLIASMPQRVDDVIRAQGGPI